MEKICRNCRFWKKYDYEYTIDFGICTYKPPPTIVKVKVSEEDTQTMGYNDCSAWVKK